MKTWRQDERGDTLVEIVIALVVIGIVVAAFFGAITTSASASKSQQDFVTADAVLRNYAEATKQSVRTNCTALNGGQPIPTTNYPTVPSGFTVSATGPNGFNCPSSLTSVNEIDITATLPAGQHKTLSIDVRTP